MYCTYVLLVLEADPSSLYPCHGGVLPPLLTCDDSNLHAVQAGNLGVAMAGSLPSCLLLLHRELIESPVKLLTLAERRATGGVAQAPWTLPQGSVSRTEDCDQNWEMKTTRQMSTVYATARSQPCSWWM